MRDILKFVQSVGFFLRCGSFSVNLQEAGTACEVESKNLRALPEIDSEPRRVTHSAEGGGEGSA